jgi:hypothetical protein
VLEIINRTPFTAELHTALDKDCFDYVVIVIKAACRIIDQEVLQLADDKATIHHANIHFGDPQTTSIQYATDVVRAKSMTDIVVNGHAYAPEGNCSVVDVGLRIDKLQIIRRIFGKRYWESSAFGWRISPPGVFDSVPLKFEHAFGGSYVDSKQQLVDCFAANPLGKGFISTYSEGPTEGQALPNIEFPQQLIEKWTDKPQPAALGFIANNWQPRIGYQGTYGEVWQNNRAPLLPEDFDERFFNAAPADLQVPYLRGGEHITLARLAACGSLSFQIPTWQLSVCVVAKGRAVDLVPVLDTLVIEPDQKQAQLTWRISVKCFNQFLYLDKVIVSVRGFQA